MSLRKASCLLCLLLLVFCATPAISAGKSGPTTTKGTPLVASFLDCGAVYCVNGDGVGGGNYVYTLPVTANYVNGDNWLQVYIGGSGRDANLVTYNTGRTLRLTFDPASAAYKAAFSDSGLPQSVNAESDLFGINQEGAYITGMSVTDTGQVQMTLEFHVGRITYELFWGSVGAVKISSKTWLLTTNPDDLAYFGLTYSDIGFTFGPAATLSVAKRHSFASYGGVSMPIRYFLQLK